MTIQSLDVRELAREMDDLRQDVDLDEEDTERLNLLEQLDHELGGKGLHGDDLSQLILDSSFEEFAEQEWEETADFKADGSVWPYRHINWAEAAEELQQDYQSIEFDGDTYWYLDRG